MVGLSGVNRGSRFLGSGYWTDYISAEENVNDRVWTCSVGERLGEISKRHFGLKENVYNGSKTEGRAKLLNTVICLKQKAGSVVK